jgi:hypothetical protein
VKDLIQNKRATIDMLRVKIDRLIGVIKSHKHDKVVLLLGPIKRELDRYFLEPKKEAEASAKKKPQQNKSEVQLIELLHEQSKERSKENIAVSINEETFRF